VKLAGPAVILSFAAGAVIALTVMWALAEMAVEHPAAGSFGLYAEMYLHPWAGFAVRYTYWLCLVMIVGSEVVAAAIYCDFWSPGVPIWIWIAGFSSILILINTLSIEDFGSIEYWFAMIKVVTIVAFLILGAMLLFGVGFPRIGLNNFTAHGGFFAHGWRGVGLGVVMAIFSFLGLEIVGVTAGEAADPKTAVPRALRRTLGYLALFYLGGLALVVGIVPWPEIGLGQSPFVRVFERAGIPAASNIMNFVVLSAALSSALCNLYFTARMLFSLARGGFAPPFLGQLSKKGMPVAAVLVSSVGMAVALVLSQTLKQTAFVFSDWLSVFWRTIHLADDAGDAHRVSLARGQRKSRHCAHRSSGNLEFHCRNCCAACGSRFHLVDPGFPRGVALRATVVGIPDRMLFCLAKAWFA